MNSTATLVKSSDWGILGTWLDDTTLETILCRVGHTSILCINKNGRALANALLKEERDLANTLLKEERDDRARAVKGSEKNWTAHNLIYLMVEKNMDSLNLSLPITVRGDCEILMKMTRAAFGWLVLGSALSKTSYMLGADMMDDTYYAYDSEDDFHPVLRDRPSHAMAFQNALIYLSDVCVVTKISHIIDRQPILEWNNSSGLLCIRPSYKLRDTFNIGAISSSMKSALTALTLKKRLCKPSARSTTSMITSLASTESLNQGISTPRWLLCCLQTTWA